MIGIRVALLLTLVLPSVALAQDGPTRIETTPAATDPSASIPLRDFLSARIEQLQQVMDERDKRYAQRFEAQQEALAAALLSAEKAVANALAAAKEAVIKAEDASNKRFDGVNEFRQSLDDVTRLQMPRAEAEARFDTLDEKVASIASRLDNMRASSEGSASTYALIGAGVFMVIALLTFAMAAQRFRKEAQSS